MFFIKKKSKRKRISDDSASDNKNEQSNKKKAPIASELEKNLILIRNQLGKSTDITIRQLETDHLQIPVAVIYTDGIVDKNIVNDFILKSLQNESVDHALANKKTNKEIFEMIRINTLAVGEINVLKNWDAVLVA